jgi:hypothetical protein
MTCNNSLVVILGTIHHITKQDVRKSTQIWMVPTSLTRCSQWKVLIVDRDSQRLLDNVIDADALLNENITSMPNFNRRARKT